MEPERRARSAGQDEVRMLTDYLPIAVLVTLATLLAFLIVGLGHLFGPRRPTLRKSQPYESGMTPYGPGQRRVPLRFYLVAVLFILFDIETVFLLPWAVVLRELRVTGLVEMAVFIAILLVGYLYAWKRGALEWE
jgi:NADH-quinone oxidoreductase subunit A